MIHRRAAIFNAIEGILQDLLPADTTYPIRIRTIQKAFPQWAGLVQQGAIPAIFLYDGERGTKTDSDVIGLIEEYFPVSLTVLLHEGTGDKALTDQSSDAHYSIERLLNLHKTLGVEGVIDTRIRTWESSQERLLPYYLIKFHIFVQHEYSVLESV